MSLVGSHANLQWSAEEADRGFTEAAGATKLKGQSADQDFGSDRDDDDWDDGDDRAKNAYSNTSAPLVQLHGEYRAATALGLKVWG